MARAYASFEAFLADLAPDQRVQVETLCGIVRAADARLAEGITWNSPSWSLDGAHRLTVDLKNRLGLVTIVLHMGTGVPERRGAAPVLTRDEGLVQWQSDIRGIIAFADAADLAAKADAVTRVIREWLEIPAVSPGD